MRLLQICNRRPWRPGTAAIRIRAEARLGEMLTGFNRRDYGDAEFYYR
jgi:hypothetical protein